MKITAQPCRQQVEGKQHHHNGQPKQGLLFQRVFPPKQDTGINAGHPADDNNQRGVVQKAFKPAAGTGKTHRGKLLCVGDDTARLVAEQCKLAKAEAAKYNGNGGDTEHQHTVQHIAAGEHQHIITFEKDTRTNHDADDHSDGGHQAIITFVHNNILSIVFCAKGKDALLPV
ncbi:hypothetical protein SDC9_119347 [bioreactor metagenome]|uniref:Uncharacterized protein n=1 Tax=bioreactor metagenome TaxID=1076179 RepID=A0A645C8N2_9ZZZZ